MPASPRTPRTSLFGVPRPRLTSRGRPPGSRVGRPLPGRCGAILILVPLLCCLSAVETHVVRGPLTSLIPAPTTLPDHAQAVTVHAHVEGPVPAGMGIGLYRSDQDGLWFQQTLPQSLTAGTGSWHFDLSATRPISEPGWAQWLPPDADFCRQYGLFVWGTGDTPVRLRIHDWLVETSPPSTPATPALRDLFLEGMNTRGHARAYTGIRWHLHARPHPMPADPYDPERFRIDLHITAPDGREIVRPGFYRQPMTISDRGDVDVGTAAGAGRFEVRYRPHRPGRHTMALVVTTGEQQHRHDLPDLLVHGPVWDDFVRPSEQDDRFLVRGGEHVPARFYWPTGVNMRSVFDLRCAQRLGTQVTPNRIWFAYRDYLQRFATAGTQHVELWLSAWNLALEWQSGRPEFRGVGQVNQTNAERLDRVLDHAWRLGIRCTLVVNNHGQGSSGTDREWADSPYNEANGGPLPADGAEQLFSEPVALAYQHRMRRYLVARYGDHPAVLQWKLWSEINLTDGGRSMRRSSAGRVAVMTWHRDAARDFQSMDRTGRPVSTHWAGNYRTPDRRLAAVPELTMLCIDAYHGDRQAIVPLMWQSTRDQTHGLHTMGKPVLVAEYGGSSAACPPPQMRAEHASAGWAALMAGHAGAPLLWWFEWVDQNGHWGPYRALARYIADEDLRGGAAVRVPCNDPDLFAAAWARPGRILAYIHDLRWGRQGGKASTVPPTRMTIPISGEPGPVVVEWWDADRGEILERASLAYTGGPMEIAVPAFRRHLAVKIQRIDTPMAEQSEDWDSRTQ